MLLYHYSLNGHFNDELGNGPALTSTDVSFTDGPRPGTKAASFNVSELGRGVNLHTPNGITIPQECVITFWFKHRINAAETRNLMFFCLDSESVTRGPNLYLVPNGNVLEPFFNTGNGSDNPFNGIVVPEAGVWSFCAVFCSSSSNILTFNAESWESSATYVNPAQTNRALTIGNYEDPDFNYGFNGEIADFRIYDNQDNFNTWRLGKLIQEQRKQPYLRIDTNHYGVLRDISGNNSKVAYVNDVRRGQFHVGSGIRSKYCMFFDGDHNQAINVTMRRPYQYSRLTIAAWFYLDEATVEQYAIVWSFGLPYLALQEGFARLSYSRRSNSSQQSVQGSISVPLKTWTHIAAVFDGGASKIQLYVNGVLDNEVSDQITDASTNSFDIGRHKSSNTYRIWGRVDDFRLYHDVLDGTEIQQLMDDVRPADKVKLFPEHGMIGGQILEDVDWELLDGFISELDQGNARFDSAIGHPAISSAADLTASGWEYDVSSFESDSYTRSKGYFQMYTSGGVDGYIQKTLPVEYNLVRVKWGNWHTGTARLYLNGVLQKELTSGFGSHEWASPYNPGDVLRIEESGIFWVSEVWVGKKQTSVKILPNGDIKGPVIRNKYSPNILPDDWAVGSGSTPAFAANGEDSENHRIYGADPWGNPAVIWECRPDAVSDADGGWNSIGFPVDTRYTYRYSVWIKRNSETGGSVYFGHYQDDEAEVRLASMNRTSGTSTTNPYFDSDSANLAGADNWVLAVGHMFPLGSAAGSKPNHIDSGYWLMNGTKHAAETVDFNFVEGCTHLRVRNYLYYCTNVNVRVWFFGPRLEKCDGTEAPLNAILSGAVYSNLERTPQIEREPKSQLIHPTKGLILAGENLVHPLR